MASSLADLSVQPHERFFFSDGSLYLLVENSLYRVHKFLFEAHATTFPVHDLETSLNKPYVLGDVKKIDFDRLLASLYPRTLWIEEAETTQDWISILGLASKWGFVSLRARAISKIEQTLDSPVDMVTLGRQYDVPDILLPGYAVLCQSTVPLSDEEGLRLGMRDVLNIYRIRHELYGSGITPVSIDVAFAKVKEASLVTEQPGGEPDCKQTRMGTDAGSVAASQTPIENEVERGSATTPNMDSPPLEIAVLDAATLISERPEQLHPSDRPTPVSLGNESSNVTPSAFPGSTSDQCPESSESTDKLFDELTMENFDLVSAKTVKWIKTKDIKVLRQTTQLIVKKTVEEPEQSHLFALLCNAMVKDIDSKPKNKKFSMKGGKKKANPSGSLFRDYLSESCQERIEVIASEVITIGKHAAGVRRLRLIEFIGQLVNWKVVDSKSPSITEKWVTALLDANNEEKVATLCALMTRVGPFLGASPDMNSWFQRMTNVAKETSNSRIRTLLQDVTKLRERGWVAAVIL